MPKKYIFSFPGTKEDFLLSLKANPHNSCSGEKYYYYDDFIVKIAGDKLYFGVERGGHSGGYWFIPTITEYDDRTDFCGTVQYIGPDHDENRSRLKNVIDGIEFFLLFVLLLPVLLLFWIYVLIERIVRKLLKKPKPKEKTTEEKLFDLMENYMGCYRK